MTNITDWDNKKQSAGGHPHSAQKGNKRRRLGHQNAISRWNFTLLLLLCLVLGVTACSPGGNAAATAPSATSATDETTDEAENTPVETEPTPAEAVFPVTISHKYGTTVIPEAPQRVVAIGYNEQDALLALGIKPVAVRYWYGEAPFAIFPWAQDEAAGAEPEVMEMAWGELNFEAILALDPDLISGVYSGITEVEYQQLSLIAPTIAQSGDYIEFGMPWQEMTKLVGQAVGKAEEAAALVDKVEAQFAAARADNPAFAGKTIAVAYANGDGTYGFYTPEDGRGRFFTNLGFTIPDELVEIAGDSFYAHISQERLDVLDQDVIVFLGLQFLEGGRATIENDPLINQLEAMKEGRVVYVPLDCDDALQFGSVLSLEYALEGLVGLLAAATE